jgi:prepilin-type N-terminal cleavage/methylation domain-containing protein
MKPFNKRAFTLIELLVVIAIIAILAAILFPVFAQAKAAAKETVAISNFKQLSLGLIMYSNDYDDQVVLVYAYGGYQGVPGTWAGLVQPYIKNWDIFWDPTRSKPSPEANGLWNNPAYSSYGYSQGWVVPTGINLTGYAYSYNGTGCTNPWASDSGPRNLTSFSSPSERMALAPTTFGVYGWMNFRGPESSWPTFGAHYETSGFSWDNLVYETTYTHAASQIPVAFADGHAKKIGLSSFVDANVFPTVGDYCAQMDARNLWPLWGQSWVPN